MGHHSVRQGQLENSSIYTQLRIMDDNPRSFQDHPLKTLGAAVFTRICYTCITKYLKKKENPVRKKPITKPSLHAQLQTMGDTLEYFKIIH